MAPALAADMQAYLQFLKQKVELEEASLVDAVGDSSKTNVPFQ
jgi:hypothetical protein